VCKTIENQPNKFRSTLAGIVLILIGSISILYFSIFNQNVAQQSLVMQFFGLGMSGVGMVCLARGVINLTTRLLIIIGSLAIFGDLLIILLCLLASAMPTSWR
jgi:hypothetical protein